MAVDHPAMKSARLSGPQVFVLFVLRVLVGWHFLYEGLVKLLDPNWTAAGYLSQARWHFSEYFHWIVDQPIVLRVVDLANMWGLTLIGLGLVLGILPRLASVFGIMLLALYYLASPAVPGYFNWTGGQGHYLYINNNLIEMAALAIILFFPESTRLGLAGLWRRQPRRGRELVPGRALLAGDNLPVSADMPGNRRELLQSLAGLPVFGAFIYAVLKTHGWKSFEERALIAFKDKPADAVTSASVLMATKANPRDVKGTLKTGRIGPLEISRLLCGGNLLSGFAHSRDLIYASPLVRQYFTDEKVIETLWLCEACGINTAIVRVSEREIRILNKYWKQGGKIKWLAQAYPGRPDPNDLTSSVQLALDNGAAGVYIQGNIADGWTKEKQIDKFEKVIAYIKDRKVIAGTAAHELEVVQMVEDAGIDVDFYMKTLHRIDYWSYKAETQFAPVSENPNDNYWATGPEKTIAYMQKVGKPWIAYKVLAAGAIAPGKSDRDRVPGDGFRYAFENGADFICVGMFDFQVVDDVNIVNEVLAEDLPRQRAWLA